MQLAKQRRSSRAAWGLAAIGAGAGLLAVALDLFGDDPRALGAIPQTGLAAAGLSGEAAGASEWILVVAAALGLWGWLSRPGWRLRAGAIAALAVVTVAIHAAAWPRIDRDNGPYAFRAQPDDSLRGRYARHHTWIVSRTRVYLLTGDAIAGRELRWVEGSSLDPQRLLALARPERIVRWEPPPLSAERAHAFLRRRTTARLAQRPKDAEPFEFRLVTPQARTARYFVAIRIGDTEFVVGQPTWERLVAAAGG